MTASVPAYRAAIGAGPGNGPSGVSTGMVIAGAVCLLALPSAVLAFTASFSASNETAVPAASTSGTGDGLGGDSPGMRLARGMSLQSLARGQLYLFTPASNPNRPDRSVTVAVRIDPQALHGIAARGPAPAAGSDTAAGLGLAQTGFSLGVARGYRTFAPGLAPAPATRRNEPPDLSSYTIAGKPTRRDDPRFSSRVIYDDRPQAGRSARTFAGDKDEQVDVSGSYRLTRNLDVTAGVRYSQDRERLLPLTDGRQDSQAVYVGTQIHF